MNDLIDLEILLKKFELLTKTIHSKEDEFNIFLQRYHYYKKHFSQSMINGHYKDCILLNQKSYNLIKSIDFCNCFYIQMFPRKLCLEISESIGLEYMLNF